MRRPTWRALNLRLIDVPMSFVITHLHFRSVPALATAPAATGTAATVNGTQRTTDDRPADYSRRARGCCHTQWVDATAITVYSVFILVIKIGYNSPGDIVVYIYLNS